MKKIINGRLYNTDTATFIASCGWGNPDDFEYYCDRLYRKKTGEFFLFGEGGPYSKYGGWADEENLVSGKIVRPMSEDAAKKWLENQGDVDKYIELFGEVEE